MIRGLSPFPGAWAEVGGERIKVLLSEVATGQGAPGTVIDDRLTVACGRGAVRLLRSPTVGWGGDRRRRVPARATVCGRRDCGKSERR